MNRNFFSAAQAEAVSHCIRQRIPFAIFFEPGSDTGSFNATDLSVDADVNRFCDKSAKESFAVSLFAQSDRCVVIDKKYDEQSVLSLKRERTASEAEQVHSVTTVTYDMYSKYVGKTIVSLNKTGGKLVLARVIACEGGDPTEVARHYFPRFPQSFRYIYYTPQTGLWLGATPETLIDYDYGRMTAKSMSLAGTRAAGCGEAWDKKNSDEHDFVTRHIKKVFEKYGENVTVSPRCELNFGEIEHLCEFISATRVTNPGDMIAELSPTPAVCGTMPDSAKVIGSLEPFDRSCYGGWLGVKRESGLRTFVNLRCAKAIAKEGDKHDYIVFAGGGITADSVVGQEWEETTKKSQPLLTSIAKTHYEEHR